MKTLLLLGALLLASRPGAAQPARPAAPDTVAIAPPAAPDTVAALHRLFAGRRHRRNIIAASLGAGLVLNSIDASLTAGDKAAGRRPILNLGGAPGSPAPASGGTPVATTWLLALLPTSSLIGLDYLAYAGFTRRREAQAIESYQAGRLAPRLRKKLRPKHFRPTRTR